MPLIHNNILSVTVPEMVECGISEQTMKVNLCKQRQGLVYCWTHHKEGKRVYIHYDGLKDTYKNLIKQVLCGGVEPDLYLENQSAERLNRELTALCKNLANLVEVQDSDIKNLSDRKLFSQTDIQRIARAAGWLRLWRKMDVKIARKYGFKSVVEIQSELFNQCLSGKNGNLDPTKTDQSDPQKFG